MKKRIAFTLAEVIIVIGIVGMVAEMTIPNLVAQYQKQQYVTQLKQTVSQLQTAFKMFMADEGISKLTDTNTFLIVGNEDPDYASQRVGFDFFRKYYRIIKDCQTEDPSSCFAKSYRSLDGLFLNPTGITGCSYSIITANNTSICIVLPTDGGAPGYLMVDINGLKPPNRGGRDFFALSFYYDGTLDEGVTPECRKGMDHKCSNGAYSTPAEARENRYENACKAELSATYGSGCFAKILNDGWKMDY